jgi:hypothetical protein
MVVEAYGFAGGGYRKVSHSALDLGKIGDGNGF